MSPTRIHPSKIFQHAWFYLALAACFAIGWFFPESGAWMKRVGATPYLVSIAFFLNGFTLSSNALIGNLRQWHLLVVAMLLTFGVAPGIVLAVRLFLPAARTPLGDGFLLLSAVPTTLVSAVVLSRMAKGNGAMALYITVLANLLAIVVVPVLIRLTVGSNTQMDVIGTAMSLVMTVLLPTIVGQIARRFFHRWAVAHMHSLGILSQITVLLFIITALAALPRGGVSDAMWAIVFALGMGFHIVLLGVAEGTGFLLRADQPSRRALTFCTAQKTLILTVFLWERLLAPLGPAYGIAILPGITYYVTELIFDSVLAQWWGHRTDADAPLPTTAT